MLDFPGEEEVIQQVADELGSEFEFAERILRYWMNYRKEPVLRRSKLPRVALEVPMVLFVQATRHFRSSIEECRRGEAAGGLIATRSLFETVLAQYFILKPTVRIFVRPQIDKARQQPKVTQDGRLKYQAVAPSAKSRGTSADDLSCELRAHLYLAYTAISEKMAVRKWLQHKGMKRAGRRVGREATINSAAVEQIVGPKWTYILEESNTYCGLSVRAISGLLNQSLLRWYDTIYFMQSKVVHGLDALRYLEQRADWYGSAWHSTISELKGTLQIGCCLYLILMSNMQKYMGFSAGVRMTVDNLHSEFERVFH